jgi:hypothetical protein
MAELRVLERVLSSGTVVHLVLEPQADGMVRIVRFERRGRHERAFARKPAWEGRVERFEALLPGGSFFGLRLAEPHWWHNDKRPSRMACGQVAEWPISVPSVPRAVRQRRSTACLLLLVWTGPESLPRPHTKTRGSELHKDLHGSQ